MAARIAVTVADLAFGHLAIGIKAAGLKGADDMGGDRGKAHGCLLFWPI
jgi:hypothetical protein